MEYQDFLKTKSVKIKNYGPEPGEVHPSLFPFQRDVVRWAVRRGRCAVWLDTGLGKTRIQLEWARLIGETALIIAPLSVARQTVREASKIGMVVPYVRSQNEITPDNKIFITNYEMVDNFNISAFGAVVLDESSILKSLSGQTRKKLTELCADIPYRLACTATPAPNDYTEIGNHAEFLGICSQQEMLSRFFVNANKEHTYNIDGKSYHRKGSNAAGTEWRLKHHAESAFFQWLASWAMTMTKPSDLGYDDDGFILPELTINPMFVEADYTPTDQLFFTRLHGIEDRTKIRKMTIEKRFEMLKDVLATAPDDQWIIWCGLDDESNLLEKNIPGAINVKGSDKPEDKAQAFEDFQDGKFRILLTKIKIGGYGLNMQQAHKMIFFGMNDSWEAFYQAIRREWRYRQAHPVDVYLILSDIESEIYRNVMRKDAMAKRLRAKLIENITTYEKGELTMTDDNIQSVYQESEVTGQHFVAKLGDSCVRLKEIADNSIDLTVYSPPFADLFTYSPSERDLGNSKNKDEFFEHYKFIIAELLRVTKPGRLSCVHTSDIAAMAQRDGYIGVKDFPGEVIRAHEAKGWVFTGRAFVQKNPQALRNGTPVLTPYGWKAIDKLLAGDSVIGSNGEPIEVKGVYPHHNEQLYRVSFSDGTSIDCHSEHLWTVDTYGSRPVRKTITTDALYTQGAVRKSGTPKYRIPIMSRSAKFYTNNNLPIEPYLLGVLLGDGCISQERTIEVCTDDEIIKNLILPAHHKIVYRPGGDRADGRTKTASIVCDEWHKNDVLSELRKLGLQGKRAWEKSIPSQYLLANVPARQALLRGLLDTDGTVKNTGSVIYSTTSITLAENVRELVNSLGGIGLIRKSAGSKYRHNGDERFGRDLYSVYVQLPYTWNPFRLARKANKWHARQRGFWRSITDIKKIDTDDCTCITVNAKDGLFVTKNYVLTHNSQAIRVKSKALLFVQLRKDSSDSRPALVDQVLIFKKPGENAVPITPVEHGELDNETWIEWANGIWLGISESDTLQFTKARDTGDEKHICALQLGTIERCIKLYSNPGETVLTPFLGIGSEAYQAVRFGRSAIGIELKESYFNTAVNNLKRAEATYRVDLFTWAATQKQEEA